MKQYKQKCMEAAVSQQQKSWSTVAVVQTHTSRRKFNTKRQISLALWSISFIYLSFTLNEANSTVAYDDAAKVVSSKLNRISSNGNTMLSLESNTSGQVGARRSTQNLIDYHGLGPIAQDRNCTPPAIDDFPRDLFTQAQRQQGFLAIHFLASAYIFYCFTLICDEYFVPCIQCICDEFQLPDDVAGATFMAIATSSPELFTNVVGTFVTKGDLGVGTIVGSAVFNILGVCALSGLAAKNALPLEWYPLTRDCIFYFISVMLLIIYLGKQQVFWYEALILVLTYALYIFVMYKNNSLRKWTERLVARIRHSTEEDVGQISRFEAKDPLPISNEKTPLLCSGGDLKTYLQENVNKNRESIAEVIVESDINSSSESHKSEEHWTLTRFPYQGGFLIWIQWLISWPARFSLFFTVPDCRKEKLKKFYPITFLMCIAWIGVLSYFIGWLMAVIGHTLSIPDSVTGLTFIAAGNSVPELVSSIIVARQGHGTMSISNSIGSNTFDILLCLGLPWLIRASMISSEPVDYIKINSGGLEYSVIMLLVSLFLLYTILACNNFYLDKKVGLIALVLYFCFIVLASMFEMNVFFTVNLPTCHTDY